MSTDNIKLAIERIEEARKNQSSYLNLSGFGLFEIPEDISDMCYLRDIDLSFNQLSKFPLDLAELTNLGSLNLSYNYLSELNFYEFKYYSLVEIDISNNAFNFIPEELFYFQSEIVVNYKNNPFSYNLPLELHDTEDLEYVQYYLDSLKEDYSGLKLYETKLLIVGKGEVGKTTLMKVIQNPKLIVEKGKEETTHGIDIKSTDMEVVFPAIDSHYTPFKDFDNLYFNPSELDRDLYKNEFTKLSDFIDLHVIPFDEEVIEWQRSTNPHEELPFKSFIKKNIKVNIWDFGGQEILYSTHQFFLTQRSIYLFVWEPRTDKEEESFDYWLNTIQRLGKDSPIIVVMNKADIIIKTIDERAYLEKFENIQAFLNVSCITKEGINSLVDKIKESIVSIPYMGDRMPTSWDRIRNELKGLNLDYIDFSHFLDICGSSNEKNAIYLSNYLRDLGDIIYFEDDFNLQNLVVINPQWLTKAIYELIHSLEIQKNSGLFDRKKLVKLLNKKKYPKDKHLEILALMERFEICFKIIGERDLYIIPALLQASPTEPKLINSFKTPESLKFEIQYRYMPSGIIERLICRLNNYLKEDFFWKYGAVFNTEYSEAIVIADKFERKISLYVLGSIPTELYNIVKHELKEIHNQLKLIETDYKERIACNCHECAMTDEAHMFDIRLLKKYLNKPKDTIDCQTSLDPINIRELLSGYKSKNYSQSLVRQFIGAISLLQTRHKIIQDFKEDAINTFFQDLLRPSLAEKGYFTNEQSLKGASQSEKQTGELDINIEDIKGHSITFYEGFILTSLDKKVINKHIEKTIINYDSNGLKEKFIGVYCRVKNFSSLVQKYESHLSTLEIKGISFSIVENLSKIYVNGSEIKLFRTIYNRNEVRLSVFHILVNLAQ